MKPIGLFAHSFSNLSAENKALYWFTMSLYYAHPCWHNVSIFVTACIERNGKSPLIVDKTEMFSLKSTVVFLQKGFALKLFSKQHQLWQSMMCVISNDITTRTTLHSSSIRYPMSCILPGYSEGLVNPYHEFKNLAIEYFWIACQFITLFL
jgi:hypothetical protein